MTERKILTKNLAVQGTLRRIAKTAPKFRILLDPAIAWQFD